jgi:type II secretory pathway component PulF
VTDEGESLPRPLGLLIVSALLAGFTSYAALRSANVMRNYREMFESFGADLPPLTEFVLDAGNFWWLIAAPCVGVFLWIATRSRVTRAQNSRMKLAVAATLAFGALVYGVVAYAVYVPLASLGRDV